MNHRVLKIILGIALILGSITVIVFGAPELNDTGELFVDIGALVILLVGMGFMLWGIGFCDLYCQRYCSREENDINGRFSYLPR